MKYDKKIKVVLMTLLLSVLMVFMKEEAFAEEISVEKAKNGIVKVVTGLNSVEGEFCSVKASCGFIVCNKENGVYIITTKDSILLSEKEKKKYCKKNKVDADISVSNTVIKIVIQGDVAYEVDIEAESDKGNFCVLSCADVLNEKEALHLGEPDDLQIGEEVYSLGFATDSSGDKEILLEEIELHAGTTQDALAVKKGNTYIQHSALITEAQNGGALVTSEGYVIGLNQSVFSEEIAGASYSLNIDEIKIILDNYGIFYDSKLRNEEIKKLQKTYDECVVLSTSKKYKNDSITQMQEALQEVATVMEQTDVEMEMVLEAQKLLEDAKSQMILKTSKWKIIQIVLFLVLIVFFIRFVVLFIQWRKLSSGSNEADTSRNRVLPVSERQAIAVGYAEPSARNEITSKQESNIENIVVESEKKNPSLPKWNEFEQEETVILRSGKNTESGNVVSEFNKNMARLVSQKTGENFFIVQKDFKIGRGENKVEMSVENKAVSMIHALIRWTEGKYYIFDLGSVNGTYVNGKKVDGNGRQIFHQDILRFADEDFEFIIKEV